MNKSKYLKWIAGFELLSFLIGLVAYVIYMFKTINVLKDTSGNGWTIFLLILGLIAILFFGPATFVLFNSVGDLLEIHQRELLHYAIEKEKAREAYIETGFSVGDKVMTTKDLEIPDGAKIPAHSIGRVTEILSEIRIAVAFKLDPCSDEEKILKIRADLITKVGKSDEKED